MTRPASLLPRLTDRDQLVEMTRGALRDGSAGLSDLSRTITMLLSEDAWQERYVRRLGRMQTFGRFEDFVAMHPLKGWAPTWSPLTNCAAISPGVPFPT